VEGFTRSWDTSLMHQKNMQTTARWQRLWTSQHPN